MGVVTIDCVVHLRCVRCGKPWEEKETMHVRVGITNTITGSGCDCREHVLMDMKNVNNIICLGCYEEMSVKLMDLSLRITALNNQIDNYNKAAKILAGCMRDEASDNDRHREN